jgi:hypothetical protein
MRRRPPAGLTIRIFPFSAGKDGRINMRWAVQVLTDAKHLVGSHLDVRASWMFDNPA